LSLFFGIFDHFSLPRRQAIEEWFANKKSGQRSPMTNEPLPTTSVFPNKPLRKAIEEYMSERPESEPLLLSFSHLDNVLDSALSIKAHSQRAGQKEPGKDREDLDR
jgi:hypothetical protein